MSEAPQPKKNRQQLRREAREKKALPNVNILDNHERFSQINRIWAENGLVKMEPKGNGARPAGIIAMPYKQAAKRAMALNNMIDEMKGKAPDEYIRNLLRLIDTTIRACQEARLQQGNPDKKTKDIQNILEGKATDGRPILDGLPRDYWMDRFQKRFFTLSKKEIEVVLDSRRFENMRKRELMLMTIHRQRLPTITPPPQPAPGQP